MAVTIASEPGSVVAAGNCIRYELSLSDGGSGTEVKSSGYQLYDGSNNPMTPEIEQIPYTGEDEAVDFQKVLAKQLQTTVQQPGALINTQDSNFALDFYLKYGEVVFDSSDCSTDTSDVTNNGTTKTVANIAFQWHQDQSNLATGVTPCTNRPLKSYVCRDQSDWLWIYKKASGNYSVQVFVYYTDGTNTAKSFEVTPGAQIFSVGPGNFFDTDFDIAGKTWSYYVIEIYSDLSVTLEKTFTFYVLDCCAALSTKQIFWLEPMGGYCSLAFDDVQFGSALSSNVYDQGLDCSLSSASDWGKSGGKSKSRTTTIRRLTMKKTMPYEAGITLWLEGLIGSRSHFVNYPGPSGDVLAKFVLADGNYTLADNGRSVELTISGELHLDLNVL